MISKISAYARLARLDKPVGIWLLFIPCCFGLLLAGAGDLWLFAAFAAGSVLMRSAGCVINDIFDRKIDALVERTKTRPLASGELNLSEALIFLAALLALSLIILLSLPILAVYLGFAIVPLVLAYPLMKRITFFPQAFLGITFNFGVLMGYAAVRGDLSLAPLLLYAGCIFWTIAYDTIYALQDIEDDLRVGVKSTAIRFGKHCKTITALCFAMFITLFTASLAESATLTIAAILSTLLVNALFCWKLVGLDVQNKLQCLRFFKMNVLIGTLLVAGLVF